MSSALRRAGVTALVVATAGVSVGVGSVRLAAADTVTATTGVNIRSGPGTGYKIVGGLYRGQKITAVGDPKKGWMQVRFNGSKAYVSARHLDRDGGSGIGAPAKIYTTGSKIATATLNVRSKPGTRSKIIGYFSRGQNVTLTGKQHSGWVEVLYGGQRAWVSSQYLASSMNKLSTRTSTRIATADLLIRTSADAGFKVITTVRKGSSLKVTGKTRNGYAQVVYKSAYRWVTAKYLSNPNSSSTDRPSGNQGNKGDKATPKVTGSRYATVQLRVRDRWQTGDQTVASVPAGTKLQITGTQRNGRAQIVYRGSVGWVTAEWLSKSKPGSGSSPSSGGSGSKVTGHRYTTADLNLRTAPRLNSSVVTVLERGTKIAVTKKITSGFRQVRYRKQFRWASVDYLSKQKPSGSNGGSSGKPSTGRCASGSAVESGLTPDAIGVHRALCARYPQVSTYYGLRPGDSGYHGSGRAIDAMISDQTAGWQMAYWLRANAGRLGVSEVIFAQRIWTVQRSSEGWRWMEDRGSATANHYDHVHVSVYGYAADS